jgi:phosphoribosylformylglycinamidine cyclo-ligase
VTAGDAVVGIASPGLRQNGYSLARAALIDRARRALDEPAWPGAERSLGDELMLPSVVYAKAMIDLRAEVDVHAYAHVTGGGIPDNLARVVPAHLDAHVRRDSWPEPRIFAEVQAAGDIADAEMERVFNLGVGMLAIVPSDDAEAAVTALRASGHDAFVVGEIVDGRGEVVVTRAG